MKVETDIKDYLFPSQHGVWAAPICLGPWAPELGSAVRLLWPMAVEQISQGALEAENQCLCNFKSLASASHCCQKGCIKAPWMEIAAIWTGLED